MMNPQASPLISAQALDERLGEPRLAILDATFYLPTQKRDSASEYRQEHIPGAQLFDVDVIANQQSDLPHMLPNAAQFAAAVGAIGIDNQTTVVAYDNNHFLASARVWWMFRVFGHDRVYVLDGGINAWKREQYSLRSDYIEAAEKQNFDAHFRPKLVCSLDDVKQISASDPRQIIDARPAGRFAGSENEPRPGLRSGHIPGSRNVPFMNLIDSNTKSMLPPKRLRMEFASADVDIDEPLLTSCGSGVTAAILSLALHNLGRHDIPIYDGSWSEWGARTDTDVATRRGD